MPASRTTTTDLRGRRRRRTGPRRILALALTAVALTPAAAVAHPADATDALRAARAATTPPASGARPRPTAGAAAPADPDAAPPEPAGGGTSWATIALAGLGACLAGAGAVVGAERRLRVRHSRIPA